MLYADDWNGVESGHEFFLDTLEGTWPRGIVLENRYLHDQGGSLQGCAKCENVKYHRFRIQTRVVSAWVAEHTNGKIARALCVLLILIKLLRWDATALPAASPTAAACGAILGVTHLTCIWQRAQAVLRDGIWLFEHAIALKRSMRYSEHQKLRRVTPRLATLSTRLDRQALALGMVKIMTSSSTTRSLEL